MCINTYKSKNKLN